jgi:hypothetical protein
MKLKLSPSRSLRVPEHLIKQLDLKRQIAEFRAEELKQARLEDFKAKEREENND